MPPNPRPFPSTYPRPLLTTCDDGLPGPPDPAEYRRRASTMRMFQEPRQRSLAINVEGRSLETMVSSSHEVPMSATQSRPGGNMQLDLDHFAERLVAGMSEALIYADAKGIIRYWNCGAARIFGFTAEEALGQPLDIIMPPRLRERHWEGYHATMRTGQSRYGEGHLLSVPAIRNDGARISVDFTIVPFTDDAGRMVGIAAIMRDATKSFEELRALRREVATHQAGRIG